MMTSMEMPETPQSQNASTSEDISVCCSSWTVRSDHNRNSGTLIINHHRHVHIDRNSCILINLHRKSKMNLQEVTPFTESWNVFNLVTHFERHDKKNYLQVCMQCEVTVRLIRSQISIWIFNVQFEITWLMQSGNFIKLDLKRTWERFTFHIHIHRANFTHFSPRMILLVECQCTSLSHRLPSFWANPTSHHSRQLVTPHPMPIKFCQTMAMVSCRIQHREDQVLSVAEPQFRSSQYW